jgi:phage/plasmid-associated DNA primase
LEFLEDIFNANKPLIQRYLRVFAYAANGMKREENIFFLIGLGGEPA